jgi:restriction endonuclease S subunit
VSGSTDWRQERLADLGQWFGGGTPSKKNDDYWTGGDVPWVSPKDMKQQVLSGSADRITRVAVEETAVRLAPANTVALVVRSGILEHTLPIALVPFAATFNQDMRVVIPREDVDPHWLLYALLAQRETIRRTCQKDGTTVASINVPVLMEYVIEVPPLSEQTEIAARLARVESEVFRPARGDLSDAQVLASAYSDAVLRDAFSVTAPMVAVAEVAAVVSGQTPKGLPSLAEGEIPYYKVGDMNASEGHVMGLSRFYLTEAVARDFKVKVHPAGTVIFPKRGGAIATNKKRLLGSPAAFDLNTMGLVPSDRLLPEFLLFWLLELDLASLSDGSQVPQINHTDIAPLTLPLPEKHDQELIVEKVKSALVETEVLLGELLTLSREADTLWASVLTHAARGNLEKLDRDMRSDTEAVNGEPLTSYV